MSDLHDLVLDWYDEHARDLPWRANGASAWSVMVSEFMLQQTPVARVLPIHAQWMQRWPSPSALAADDAGEAVRAWGRLGYPRRALRLHGAATEIRDLHDGDVPQSYTELLALPGVGDYTAAAIASFAHGQRHVVLDTNVRRVFARAVEGVEFPHPTVKKAERELAASLLPTDAPTAATWAVATMELGALVCTASNPACDRCPIQHTCAWFGTGKPAYDGPARKVQGFAGTDRQVRGRLLSVVRESEGAVPKQRLDLVWSEAVQRERALASLIADGLLVRVEPDLYALP